MIQYSFSGLSVKEEMYILCIKLSINSLPINELGNWCHQRLVGALLKYQAQQGGSMATL